MASLKGIAGRSLGNYSSGLIPRSNLPWCLVGDFNDLLTQSERRERVSYPNNLIQGFRDAVHLGGFS